jgi:hypothetical protein
MGDPQGSGPPDVPPEGAPGVAGVLNQPIQIVITVEGNQLGVSGPLHDTIFCYGVLERAKDVIRTQRDQPQKQSPPGQTPGGLHIPSGGFKPPRT